MLKLFRNIPRDPKTVAALRNECDARGLAARCREKVCGRARRCRAPWRADENTPDLVLPPCLLKEQIEFSYRAIDAELALVDLRRLVARGRGLPDPDYAAEFDTLEPPPGAVDDVNAAAASACLGLYLDLAPRDRGAAPHASVRSRRR